MLNLIKKLFGDKHVKDLKALWPIVPEINKHYDELKSLSDDELRAKTGWGIRFKTQIGWFIRYLEKDENVYFFATNVESENPEKGYVSRIEITKKILSELELY